MADNVAITAGSGTTIAADDIGGILHQRVKISQGADGSATDVSSAAPLQVTVANTGPNASAINVAATGTVTANAGTNLNTSALALEAGGNLAAIATSLAALDNAIAGNEIQADVLTVPSDPFGANADAAATAGSTGTIQAKLRLMTSQLSTIATDLAAVKTSVEILDNAVAGNEFQVDIVSGAGSGGTAMADDAAFTPGTTSVTPIGGFADETGTDSVNEGDIGAVRMTLDRKLHVRATDLESLAVATVAHDADGTGNELLITGGIASAAAPTGVSADGDAVRPWHLLNGAQAVVVTAAGALIAGDAPNGLDVDVTRLPALAAGTNNIGDVDILSIAAGDNNIGNVDIASIAAGTNNIGDVDIASIAAGDNNIGNVDIVTMPNVSLNASTNTIEIVGDAAHDAVTAGNPVMMGGWANAASPTAVSADGDVVRAWHLRNGAAVAALSAGTDLIGGDATNGLDVDVIRIGGQAPAYGAGAVAATVPRVTLASDSPGILADDAAFTPGTSSVRMAGFEADEASIDSVDEGDAGAARMTLDRKQIVTTQPHALGGLSIFRSIDLDEGTLEVVKNSPGAIYGMWVTNTSTGTRFVKFYDATSGTAGTGTPVITFGVPGNSSDDVAGMFGSGNGIQFATGICVGATTGVADADTGAPGANDVVINVFYK